MRSHHDPRVCAAAGALSAALLASPALAGGDLPLLHANQFDAMIETVFPDVQWPGSDARAINEDGDVVGEAGLDYDPDIGGRMQAFVHTVEHGVVALPLPGGWPSNAVTDVSDRDSNGEILIVGGGVPGPYLDLVIGEAVVWRYSTVTGLVEETITIPLPSGFDDAIAVGVANDGTVVGYASLTGPFVNWRYDVRTGVLATFEFPARVADLNNVGQVCGGVYRGDLDGNFEDLSETYEPGDVMPDWAIENGGISAGWRRINDLGWVVGRAATGISDGAGHFLVDIVRFADGIGWTGMGPGSHLTLAGSINNHGDFTDRTGGAYLESVGDVVGLSSLIAPEFPGVSVSRLAEINDHLQVAGHMAHAFLLTPIGPMIIPGDVNGDVSVDPADFCAWVADPIDLDGDGDADQDDADWLVARLAVFGYVVDDCNGNGLADHCDIASGTSLDCDGNSIPDECQPDCDADGVPDVCESDCNANGVPDPCDIDAGTSDDCNGNGIPDECDGGGVTEVALVHEPPTLLLQDSTWSQDVLVTDAGIVDDIDLILDVRYRIGDFIIELSHGGTTITIVDRAGYPTYAGGFVNFGYDAIVDDEGAGAFLEFVGDACCSFEAIESPPAYKSMTPLNAFDGMPVEGIWTLTITTVDHFSPGDGVRGWGLEITRAGAEVPPCCPSDVDGDGTVAFGDVLGVLADWGACPATCPADLDGDGLVGFEDLLAVLAAWGPCD